MKETGITHSFTSYPDADAMQRALDTAQAAGVKLIVSCPELEKEPEATVKRFMNHPATAGYFLRDEPNTESFAELGQWAKRIRATDDAHFCYLNLLPTYASLEMLKADSYRDYVHRFDQEVPLQLLSFDHYPVVGRTLRPDYYENLEIFSDEARLAGKPVLGLLAGDRARSVSDPGSGPDAVADVQQPGLRGPGVAVFYLLDSGKEPELEFPPRADRSGRQAYRRL